MEDRLWPATEVVCFDDVQKPIALLLALCQCNCQRQVEVIPSYYALLEQLNAAFGDLLIRFFSVFQTIWISDCDRGLNSYGGFGALVKVWPTYRY